MLYTVTPLHRTVCPYTGNTQFCPDSGFVATVRRDNRVVKQFPTFKDKDDAHYVAQQYIINHRKVYQHG